MKRLAALTAVAIAFALVATDADAKRWRHHRSMSSTPVETTSATAADARDNNTLCNGGMMITADDQVRGCTGLINSGRLSRDLKAVAYYNRGNAYVGKNDFARAIEDYTQAVALKADYGAAYFNRAVAYRISGNPQAAITDYSQALMYLPSDADAFAGRGTAYAKIGKQDKAMEDLNRALTLQPANLAALTQRGHAYVRAHQWTQAIGDYDAAVALSTAAVEALYGRGVAKVYSGDVTGGQSDLTSALLVDSSVTARMTSQGIPPPQFKTATPERPYEHPQTQQSTSPIQPATTQTDRPKDDQGATSH